MGFIYTWSSPKTSAEKEMNLERPQINAKLIAPTVIEILPDKN